VAVRKRLGKIVGPLLAIASVSGFLVGFSALSSAPAGAAVSQVAGDDVPTWGIGWSWTYAEVFTINDPGTGFFNIDENVTYKVADVEQHTVYTCPTSFQGGICNPSTAPGIATAAGTYDTYKLTFTGTVTGGSGSATENGTNYNLTLNTSSSNVTGTEWVQASNLAAVEVDQDQHIVGTVNIIISVAVNIDFVNNDVYTPPQVNQDFRLHNGDTWLENTNVYDNGNVTFSAAGNNGSDNIDSYGPINATATDSTVSNGDQINYNDTTDQTSDTRVWSNAAHNIVSDNYLTGIPQGTPCTSSTPTSCEQTTQTLSSDSFPAPPVSVSEAISGPSAATGLACGGQTITVSGALGSGASGAPVSVSVDETTTTVGAFVTTHVTSTGGGAYTANVIAPNLVDGLQKPGVNGSFGVVVAGGGASASQILEVSPQDCTSLTYNGATTGAVGSTVTVSAKVTDVATGSPVSGASVSFSLAGQVGSVSGTSGATGVASASLALTDTPSATPYVLTSTYAGGPADAASSTTSNFTVTLDPTSTTVTASPPSATQGVDSPTFTAHISPTGPSSGTITGNVTFTIDGSAIGSPVPVSGGTATSSPLNTLGESLGNHNVVATYSGDSHYASSSGNIPNYSIHGPLTATTTTLGVSPSGNAPFGEPVTLTATVSPTVDNTSSAVTFFDNGTSLGSADLNGSSPDQATLVVSNLAVGGHSLTAQYNGDGNLTFNTSVSNPVSLTVNSATTTTSVTLVTPSSDPFAFEPVTFGVTVAPPAGDTQVPTGTVQIVINGVNFGAPLTLAGGSTTVDVPAGLPAGTTTVTANYSGDSGFSGGSGTLNQPVSQATTSTALVSSTGSSGSVLNQAVTFTANVTPEGAGNPGGLVTFFDCPTSAPCSTQLGQSTLSPTGSAGSQATLQLSNLAEGDNYITATYGGDSNFSGSSSSPPFDQVVSPPPPVAATSTTVVGSTTPPGTPNTSVYGQAVAFTATVSVAPSQAAISAPAGTVQFSIDGTNVGSPVPLVGGPGSPGTGWTSTAVSAPVSSLLSGGHAVIATYSGLSGAGIPQAFQGSGAIATQEVHQAASSVSGVPSANPASFGQAVTFTATLQAVAPGVGTPGGTVQFSLDGSAFGSPAAVHSGTAVSGAATGLLPGTHTVSMITSGDANFLGSNGSFTFVVNSIPTTTSLTATPNPVAFASALTLTATVSHSSGPGTPSGTVVFTDGTTVLGTVGVSPAAGGSAKASLVTSSLAVGSHPITATYSGDPQFGGSTSGTVIVSVVRQNTKIVARAAVLTEIIKNPLAPVGVLSLQPLSATLTTDKGVPIPGQLLVFTAKASPGGPLLCTGVTDAQGVATCTPNPVGTLEVDLTGGFTAVFVGSPSYNGSNGSAGLITIVL
jgi:hypothetical protein